MERIYKVPNFMCGIFAFLMLVSLNPYFVWHIDFRVKWIMYFVLTILLFFLYKERLREHNLFILLAFVIAFYTAKRGNVFAFIGPTFAILPFALFLFLNYDDQIEIIYRFKRLLCVVLAISLLGWLLFLFEVELPYLPDFYGDPLHDTSFYLVNNHFVFVRGVDDLYSNSYRFQSIFLEPGYVGCLCVFFLLLDDLKFKGWENKVLYATLAFSLSLAAWLLFAISLILIMINKGKLKYVLLGAFVLSFIYLFGINYNDGNNVVNELIIERLAWDEDQEQIAGYNRTSRNFDADFDEFIFTSKAFLGDYERFNRYIKMGDHLVGWKAYTMKFGILGLCSYVFFYLSVFMKRRINFRSVVWLGVFLLFFLRGDALAFNLTLLFLYVAGINKFSYQENS